MAASQAVKEGIWLQRLLEETGLAKSVALFKLFCDNQSAIVLAKNPKHHEKSKHIDLRYHFIRELIEGGHFILEYTPTQKMWVDFLTKPTPRIKHEKCCKFLGLQ